MSENITTTATPVAAEPVITFASLGLAPAILSAVQEAGYTVPSPIQLQAIPEALLGHDLMASAQTGTGKTAAFILPALQKLSVASKVQSKGPRILVLTPTRELAQQVSDAATKYGKNMRVKVVSILGGAISTAKQTAFKPCRYLGSDTRPFDRPHRPWPY